MSAKPSRWQARTCLAGPAAAGVWVTFNAKPVVREQADTRADVPYPDSVRYLLGISRDEIVEAGLDRE